MLSVKKILLPVDFPNTSFRVIRQAAILARHFHSEIVMLHVVTTPQRRTAGVPDDGPEAAGWDMLAEITRAPGKNLEHPLGTSLDGLTIHRVLAKGDAANAIVKTARGEKVDLIMMASQGHTFYQFLLSSVTSNAPHGTNCPVWTDAHSEKSQAQDFAIRSVLCAVNFKPRDRKTVSWAAQMAAEAGARLTLAHVTARVEFWGPGGNYINRGWKEALIDDASRQIAALQKDMGIEADVFIGSGDAPMVLGHAVKQTKADVLVTGCHPYDGHLRTHGYAIISAMPIPVLSV